MFSLLAVQTANTIGSIPDEFRPIIWISSEDLQPVCEAMCPVLKVSRRRFTGANCDVMTYGARKKTCVNSKRHSFDPSSWNFVRLFIIIISRSSLKVRHVRSKTRSLGQILEKPSVPYKGHSFDLHETMSER